MKISLGKRNVTYSQSIILGFAGFFVSAGAALFAFVLAIAMPFAGLLGKIKVVNK